VRPTDTAVEPISSVYHQEHLRIYAVPRPAGKSEFSGLACRLVRPKGRRMMDVLQMTYKRARRQINLPHRLLKSQNSKSLPIIWTSNANSQLDPLYYLKRSQPRRGTHGRPCTL
jgi:hypothetical protein